MIQDIYPHQFNNRFVVTNVISENDYILYYRGNTLLLKGKDDDMEIPRKKDFVTFPGQTEGIYMFSLNQTSCFLLRECPDLESDSFTFQEISFFRTIKRKEIAWISIVGYHLMTWYETNQFCGKCGTRANHKDDERAMVCPACKTAVYPKISPAIIVAILCKDKILLAHGANFKPDFFSLVAGYADIGESLEDAVIREVKEEVGVDVKNIRYYKSQPWPYSGSMMIGFIAEADDTQPIRIDEKEISEAAWFSRDKLPNYPLQISIAGEMIEKFERGTL
jgi:NAD+ diphosphatase